MILICHNENSQIYDDKKGNWILRDENGIDLIHSKENFPLLPLSAVVKDGMIEDNEVKMDDLRELASKLAEELAVIMAQEMKEDNLGEPERPNEHKMILMCHNTFSQMYDDENGNWVWKDDDPDEDQVFPKEDNPFLPLSAVVKYDMIEDNPDEMNKLRKLAMEAPSSGL